MELIVQVRKFESVNWRKSKVGSRTCILHKTWDPFNSATKMKRKGERGSHWKSPLFTWKLTVGLPFIKTYRELEQTHTLIHLIHLLPKFILLRTYNKYSQETESNSFSKSTLKRNKPFLFRLAKSTNSLSTRAPPNNLSWKQRSTDSMILTCRWSLSLFLSTTLKLSCICFQ